MTEVDLFALPGGFGEARQEVFRDFGLGFASQEVAGPLRGGAGPIAWTNAGW